MYGVKEGSTDRKKRDGRNSESVTN